jgi:hypothetical protein
MNRAKYKIIKIRPPSKSIAPFAIALIDGTDYSALCWDEKTAKVIRAALNASEGGVKKPPTKQGNAIAASEAYCRKHALKDVSIQRAFLDGVAWREQYK